MSTASWRTHARPIIREIVERIGLDDKKALRKALHDAYPFGERKYWPYKVWLDEIARQTRAPKPPEPGRPLPPPGPSLFDEAEP